jgi:DNA-binding CsgD family transcriptional regulator
MNGIYDLWDTLTQTRTTTVDASGIFQFYENVGFEICNIAVSDRSTGGLIGFVTNMSEAWMDHYYKREFGNVDPILKLALSTKAPVVFDAMSYLPGGEPGVHLANEMIDGFRGEGGNSSFVIPMYTHPADRQVVMGLGSNLKPSELKSMIKDSAHEILIGSALVQSFLATENLDKVSNGSYRHNPAGPFSLSPREREVLNWLASGLRTDRIADRMDITNATVNFHLKSIKQKLAAKTREQALAIAIVQRLIEP